MYRPTGLPATAELNKAATAAAGKPVGRYILLTDYRGNTNLVQVDYVLTPYAGACYTVMSLGVVAKREQLAALTAFSAGFKNGAAWASNAP